MKNDAYDSCDFENNEPEVGCTRVAALESEIESLKEKAGPGWISVEDKMPCYYMANVIACDEIGDIWFGGDWDLNFANGVWLAGKGKYKITHWMQIVAPEVKDD